ncbi:MAG: hypothetical protein KDA41_17235, partial [Planctomycetales bacterium]|nr:hypothetical protein [Planctomycetales bacterium]
DDFENPNGSQLYMELMHSPDEQVRDLTHYLMQLARYNLADVPPVDEVLLWCNSLDDLLAARDWDMAVQLVQRMGPQEQIPAHLTQLVGEAQRRVACRVALEKALAAGDEAAIQRAYAPQLLDDYPAAAQLVEKARQTSQVQHALEVLKAAEQFQNWDVFRNTWMANQALLSGRKSAERYKKQMQRIIAADTLRKMLKDVASDDGAVVQAWEYLKSLGGHPTAEALAPALQWRVQRRELQQKLQEVVAARQGPPTLELDRKYIELWKPNFFDKQPRHQPLLVEYKAAFGRLKKLKAYIELGETCTPEGERKLAAALTDLPEAYHPKLRRRCRLALRRAKALQAIRQHIQDGAALALIDAYDSLAE